MTDDNIQVYNQSGSEDSVYTVTQGDGLVGRAIDLFVLKSQYLADQQNGNTTGGSTGSSGSSGSTVSEERLQRLERAALWDPRRFTTGLWLDSNQSQNFVVDNNEISSWLDLSGQGSHLSIYEGLKPSYTANNPVAIGSQTLRKSTPANAIHSSGEHLCVFVVQNNGTSIILDNVAQDDDQRGANGIMSLFHPRIRIEDGTLYHEAGAGLATSVLDNTTNVISCLQSNEAISIYVNGTRTDVQLNTPFQGATPDFIQVGPGDFNLSELVLLSYESCTGDRQTLEGYLAHKWNISDKLEDSHPYKLGAPLVAGSDISCGYGFGS